MKILNLYAGVGGNRKLWQGHDITSVEYNESIAKIYSDLYPDDEIIITDAHEYLRLNFMNFDFIWTSPPCQTHSRLNFSGRSRGKEYQFPSMKLYEEIILLQTFFKGGFVVENVKGYYNPLIEPKEIGRHYIWSNFDFDCNIKSSKVRNEKGQTLKSKMEQRNIFINNFHGYIKDKRQLINNCVEPEIGKCILDGFKKNHSAEAKIKYGIMQNRKLNEPTQCNLYPVINSVCPMCGYWNNYDHSRGMSICGKCNRKFNRANCL